MPAINTGLLVTVYQPQAGTVPAALAILENARGVRFQVQINEVGAGEFTLNRHDAKATAVNLAPGNLVKITVNSVERFAFWVEEVSATAASPDGQGAEDYVVRGRGALAMLDQAIIYPPAPTYHLTRASAVIDQITQAVARGCLNGMTTDWSDTVDSTGAAWGDTSLQVFEVGMDLLQLAQKQTAVGNFDIAMTPGLLMKAWKTGNRGTNRSSTVVLREGIHLGAKASSYVFHYAPFKNVVIAQGPTTFGGAVVAIDPVLGRREGFLHVTSTDGATLLNAQAQAALTILGKEAQPITLQVEHGNQPGQYEPFVDYDLGDTIALDVPGEPFLSGLTAPIVSITIEHRQGYDYAVTLDLNAIRLDHQIRAHNRVRAVGF